MKVVNILIISLLLVFLEIKYSTAFSTQSLIGSIAQLFQTPIHCCLIVYFTNTSQFEFNEVTTVPLYLLNTNAETEKIQTASKLCKNHIFILNSFNDLKEIKEKDNMVKGDTGQYAFIIQKSNPEAISRMNLKEHSFFDDVLNFMIIVPGSGTSIESTGGTYLFYHKNLGNINDSQITLENIWKNGSFLTTFSKDFMKFPLTGRHLKVTSWEYAIYLYMENGKYQGFEVLLDVVFIANERF